jgi:hypothetical protein
MQDGFTVALRDIEARPDGQVQFTQNRTRSSLSGNPSGGQGTFDQVERTNTYSGNFASPYSAVLTTSDVAFTIQAALQVDPGYTLAVGGLEEASDGLNRNGIPLLQDIPELGYLFSSQGRRQRKRNLIIFITPTVVYNRTETAGITDIPISTLPQRPGSVPRPPAFTPDGQLVGGVDAVNEAILWLEYQLKFYQELDRESRVDRNTVEALRGIMRTALMIQAHLPVLAQTRPDQAAFLSSAEETIENIVSAMSRTLSSSRQKIVYF